MMIGCIISGVVNIVLNDKHFTCLFINCLLLAQVHGYASSSVLYGLDNMHYIGLVIEQGYCTHDIHKL